MRKRATSHQMPQDSPEYLQAWARDLVAAVGKREARGILDEYRALAENTKLAKRDREIAANRAKALANCL